MKGLEWPFVVVHHADTEQFPHRLATDVEEERRLFHVAITRAARDVLVVPSLEPSPFITDCSTEPNLRTAVVARSGKPAAAAAKPAPKTAGSDLSLDELRRFDGAARLAASRRVRQAGLHRVRRRHPRCDRAEQSDLARRVGAGQGHRPGEAGAVRRAGPAHPGRRLTPHPRFESSDTIRVPHTRSESSGTIRVPHTRCESSDTIRVPTRASGRSPDSDGRLGLGWVSDSDRGRWTRTGDLRLAPATWDSDRGRWTRTGDEGLGWSPGTRTGGVGVQAPRPTSQACTLAPRALTS